VIHQELSLEEIELLMKEATSEGEKRDLARQKRRIQVRKAQ
jgi:hypothetical protein